MRHVAQGPEWAGGGRSPRLPLTDMSSSLPPVPSLHCPGWPGPGFPDRGEAPTEALQGTLLCLRTVSAPFLAQAGPPRGPGEGLPLLSTWSTGPGAGLPCPGPQPSRAAVCILLTIGRDTKGPSPNKTSASKGVESKWLSRLLRQRNVQKLDPVWVVWESFPAPTPHCCQQPEPRSAAAGRGLEATLAAPRYLVCRPYGHPDGIGDKSVGVLLARHQGSPDLSLAHIL